MMAVAIGMSVFSAVAFAAASYGATEIQRKLNPDGSAEELARHDRASEELQRASSEWSQKRLAQQDYIYEQKQRVADGYKMYADVNEAARQFYEVSEGDGVGKEPTLEDFYQPSDELKKYELLFLVGSLGLGGWIAYKYL